MNLGKLKERLSASLLVIPVVAAAGSIAFALLTGWLDELVDDTVFGRTVVPGGAETIRTTLATIAASMVTFLGVVFSITMVVLQLASNRFSPRVLRTFLKDRMSQVTLGVFVATFTFSMVVLRTVPASGSQDLPVVSVVVAFTLMVASVVTFVGYVNHMARAIRISRIAASIGDETADVIAEQYPEREGDEARADEPRLPPTPSRTIPSPSGGNLEAMNEGRLAALAREADVVLALEPRMGEFVPRGAPLVHVYGDGRLDDDRVLAEIDLGEERTLAQDPSFGFRQLVDIAERSLSPGTIDPTSAVQALDQLHDLLRYLATRELPERRVTRDEDGEPRVIVPSMTWDEYLDLAVDEIVLYGRGSLQVAARLRAVLEDLDTVTSGDRLRAVRDKISSLPPPPDPYAVSRDALEQM